MRHSKWALALLVTLLALVTVFTLGSATPSAVASDEGDICGVIATSMPIDRDSRLVCDVRCLQTDNQPCINIVRPGVKLSLNGFKMTGPSNTPSLANCVTTNNFLPADGIHSVEDEVKIEGPGVVQNMKRHGIGLFGPTNPVEKAVVKKLTTHHNCFSGVWLVGVRESVVEDIVSVKNSAASSFFPCGGVCVTNSHNNHIRRSEFAGNGSVVTGPHPACPVAEANDFGVGLVGASSGNVIEENNMGGNINGILVCPGARGNLIQKNVIAGNPPIQVSASSTLDPVGADISDYSPAGANRYEENLCLTYEGLNPPPCPNIPQFAGHQNN